MTRSSTEPIPVAMKHTEGAHIPRAARAALALLVLTWMLMIVGAATRAARAGVACPDWPLCHGRLIPPLDARFYPADPSYAVYRVYLEFGHRVLAALVASGVFALCIALWRARRRTLPLVLFATLAAQVAMGALTVRLRNAPYTVVLHLALALALVAGLLAARRALAGHAAPRYAAPSVLNHGHRALLALLVIQVLVGGVVSSRSIGLACFDFPLCNGLPIPPVWTAAIGWQMLHRALGFSVVVGAFALYLLARRAGASALDRRFTLSLAAGALGQVLLGGANVWLRVPPTASAAHLGLAVLLYAALVERCLAERVGPGLLQTSPDSF